MGKFTIKIVNNRDATNLNLLLTVSGTQKGLDGGSLKVGTSITISDFFDGGGSISAEVLDGCRLYVGYGALPASPCMIPTITGVWRFMRSSSCSPSCSLGFPPA